MTCPYYYWKDTYMCRKSGAAIAQKIYETYCRENAEKTCPTYQMEQSIEGCFLTTACTQARGLPDDCHELTVLRDFRDSYLRSLPEGIMEIAEYYAVAPNIVQKIYKRADAFSVLDRIYTQLILPCVALIQTGENAKAHRLYREYLESLVQNNVPPERDEKCPLDTILAL